jgi:hypothetical protein
MKKTRRRYNRDFKISVLAELDAGKPIALVAHEYGIHLSSSSIVVGSKVSAFTYTMEFTTLFLTN